MYLSEGMRAGVLVAVAVWVGACAGRSPAPVSVVQATDRFADCAAITAEVEANTKRITELGREQDHKVAQNVIAGAAGIVIPILWFGMDFQNAAGKEIAALQSRQQYLATLAEQRCGSTIPLPIQTSPAPPATTTPPSPPATDAPAPLVDASTVPAPDTRAPAAPPPARPALKECVDPNGSKVHVAGDSCPAPWKPVT